jgi:hypothetical protein
MLEVYRTLLEDQRSVNSQFGTWFGIAVVLLLFLNGGALFVIVRAGERRYKALLKEASQSIEKGNPDWRDLYVDLTGHTGFPLPRE